MICILWSQVFEIPWIADPLLARVLSYHSNIFMAREQWFLVLLSLMVSLANFCSVILCFYFKILNISLLSVFALGGSGYCKFGWSKYACPSGRSATFLVIILVGTITKQKHFCENWLSGFCCVHTSLFYVILILTSTKERLKLQKILVADTKHCHFSFFRFFLLLLQLCFLFDVQEFGNIETPMYTRLRHFFATIYNR